MSFIIIIIIFLWKTYFMRWSARSTKDLDYSAVQLVFLPNNLYFYSREYFHKP